MTCRILFVLGKAPAACVGKPTQPHRRDASALDTPHAQHGVSIELRCAPGSVSAIAQCLVLARHRNGLARRGSRHGRWSSNVMW